MILKFLTEEFEHEVDSTRKLLQMVPEKDLSYQPCQISWTMGELAQHIATIYYWYVGTLTEDVYDMAGDQLERRRARRHQSHTKPFRAKRGKSQDGLKNAN